MSFERNEAFQEALVQIKSSVDVESLLPYLGFKISIATTNELRAPCIIHGGDNRTAFSIKLDSKRWKCFTHKCEAEVGAGRGADVIGLVMAVRKIRFIEAAQLLSDFTGIQLTTEQDQEKLERFRSGKDAAKFTKLADAINEPNLTQSKLNEEIIAGYRANLDQYFSQFGFLDSTLNFFELGSKIDDFGVVRATVPIRDHLGSLVGLSARREDGDAEPRYLLERNFQKGKVLYNLNNALLFNRELIIIVEGFKACWAIHESGHRNVVACMGAEVSEDQALLLVKCNITKVVLMLDGDRAGRIGMEKSYSKLSKYMKVRQVFLPEGLCPDDFFRKDLKDLLYNEINSI